jgi:hypothetical protein
MLLVNRRVTWHRISRTNEKPLQTEWSTALSPYGQVLGKAINEYDHNVGSKTEIKNVRSRCPIGAWPIQAHNLRENTVKVSNLSWVLLTVSILEGLILVTVTTAAS